MHVNIALFSIYLLLCGTFTLQAKTTQDSSPGPWHPRTGTGEVRAVWPRGKIPHFKPAPEETIKDDGSVARTHDVSIPTIKIYPAPQQKAPCPAVIICPGGGYQILCIDKEGSEIATYLNQQGITGIVLKYRVPRQYKAAKADIQRTIRLMRANADKLKIDPNRIGVMGFSAGANLAAVASTSWESSAYSPIDAIDKLSCKPDFSILIYPAYLNKTIKGENTYELNFESNPALQNPPKIGPVTPETPHTFIAQSNDDPYSNSALAYTIALRKAKVPVELHLYPTGGHGYGLRQMGKATDEWPNALKRWISHEVFKKPY